MFQAMFILYSLHTNEDTILMQLLIDGILSFYCKQSQIYDSDQKITGINQPEYTKKQQLSSHTKKIGCKPCTIQVHMQENQY